GWAGERLPRRRGGKAGGQRGRQPAREVGVARPQVVELRLPLGRIEPSEVAERIDGVFLAELVEVLDELLVPARERRGLEREDDVVGSAVAAVGVVAELAPEVRRRAGVRRHEAEERLLHAVRHAAGGEERAER